MPTTHFRVPQELFYLQRPVRDKEKSPLQAKSWLTTEPLSPRQTTIEIWQAGGR